MTSSPQNTTVPVFTVVAIVIVSCLISSLFAGLGVYLWLNQEIKTLKLENEIAVGDLQSQINKQLKDSTEISLDSNSEITDEDLSEDDMTTDNWNILTSEIFGFSIKYPDDYVVEENYNDKPENISFKLKDLNNNNNPYNILTFYKSPPPTMDNMDQTQTLAPVKIEGKDYAFETYVFAEGNMGGSFASIDHIIVINPNLSLHVQITSSSTAKFPEGCNEDSGLMQDGSECDIEYVDSFQVPQKYIDLTRKVIETIELNK